MSAMLDGARRIYDLNKDINRSKFYVGENALNSKYTATDRKRVLAAFKRHKDFNLVEKLTGVTRNTIRAWVLKLMPELLDGHSKRPIRMGNNGKLRKDERQEKLVELVTGNPLKTEDIAYEFNVSECTVRHDMLTLIARGLIKDVATKYGSRLVVAV